MTTSDSTRSTRSVSSFSSASRPPVATSTSQPSCVEEVAQRLADAEVVVDDQDAHARRARDRDASRAAARGARRASTRAQVEHLRAVQVLARRVLGALRQVGERRHDLLDAVDRGLRRVEPLALDDEVLVGADALDVAPRAGSGC